MRPKNGFTLVELGAVIIIIGLLAVIITPMALKTINDAKKTISSEDKKQAMDSVKTYLSDIDEGVIKYKAPENLTINNHTYSKNDEMSTYDAISYIIENEGIEISIETLIKGGYINEKCDYDTNKSKCKFKRECTIKGVIEGEKVDGFYVASNYKAHLEENCN